MVSQKLQKLLSFLSLIIFLISLVETAPTACPPAELNKQEESSKTYLIVLESTSTSSAEAVEHYNMLTSCLNKTIIKARDQTYADIPKDTILDFSVEGALVGYAGVFTDSFVLEYLSSRADVSGWAENLAYALDDANTTETASTTESLTDALNAVNTEKTSVKNLDRIDQKDFPLDGKYTYPASAGEGVNVYVIDTGININHIDFQGRASFARSFCNGCPLQDDNGHGTAVAGIIGGNFFGVAKKTKLIAVKILNSIGLGTTIDLILGMTYVLEQHLADTNKKTIVNMSLGYNVTVPMVDSVVTKLVDAGIHVVVAANNYAMDACNFTPASAPGAIAVGATEYDSDLIASFSNWGPCVDIFAPGRFITGPGVFAPDSLYVNASGTSFSSPHVAGTIALILSKSKDVLSPNQVTEELFKISTKNVVKGLNDTNTPNRFLRVPNVN